MEIYRARSQVFRSSHLWKNIDLFESFPLNMTTKWFELCKINFSVQLCWEDTLDCQCFVRKIPWIVNDNWKQRQAWALPLDGARGQQSGDMFFLKNSGGMTLSSNCIAANWDAIWRKFETASWDTKAISLFFLNITRAISEATNLAYQISIGHIKYTIHWSLLAQILVLPPSIKHAILAQWIKNINIYDIK